MLAQRLQALVHVAPRRVGRRLHDVSDLPIGQIGGKAQRQGRSLLGRKPTHDAPDVREVWRRRDSLLGDRLDGNGPAGAVSARVVRCPLGDAKQPRPGGTWFAKLGVGTKGREHALLKCVFGGIRSEPGNQIPHHDGPMSIEQRLEGDAGHARSMAPTSVAAARQTRRMPHDRLARRTAIRHGAELDTTEGLVTELRLLQTSDHHHWDALFVQAPEVEQSRTVAIVVHGSVGNYLGGVPRRLTIELARLGVPALSINTRLANFGVIYGGGLFRAAVCDVEAAVDDARKLGAEQIALVGYGQGASLTALYQAEHSVPEVAALVHVAHPGHPGLAQRERWERYGAEPRWGDVAEEAARREAAGSDDDIFVVQRGSGSTRRPEDSEVWTWRTWQEARAPDARHLDGPALARKAGVPQLLVQPSTPLARHIAASMAAAVDEAGGPPVSTATIMDADGALVGRTPEVAQTTVEFLAALENERVSRAPIREPSKSVHVLTLACSDGEEHDALLVEEPLATERRHAETARRTGIVHLHGNQGSFSVGALRYLPHPLAEAGVPVMTLETRLANASQIFGSALFEDALIDIAAAIDALGRRGFDGVILSGYSLGANLAARAVAEEWSLPVRGAMLIGTARRLGESTKRRMEQLGSTPSYDELVQQCRAAMAEKREEILVVRRLYGPADEPRLSGVYTTSTWWHSRGPEAVDSFADRHLAKARCPILLVQGTADTLVDPVDATDLAEVVRTSGGHADIAWLEGSDHLMGGHHDELIDATRAWALEHA